MNGYLETRPLRIFVVEDHVDTLNCLKLYLESLDHTVLTAQTVAEALAELPSANCEVLMVTWAADGTGWELPEKDRLPRPVYRYCDERRFPLMTPAYAVLCRLSSPSFEAFHTRRAQEYLG